MSRCCVTESWDSVWRGEDPINTTVKHSLHRKTFSSSKGTKWAQASTLVLLYKYKKKPSYLDGYRIDRCTDLKTSLLKHHHRRVVNAGTWGGTVGVRGMEHTKLSWNVSLIFIPIKKTYLLGKWGLAIWICLQRGHSICSKKQKYSYNIHFTI